MTLVRQNWIGIRIKSSFYFRNTRIVAEEKHNRKIRVNKRYVLGGGDAGDGQQNFIYMLIWTPK